MQQLTLFNYDDLTPATRTLVETRTQEIRTLMQRAAEDIKEIGGKLIEIRDTLEYGQFDAWLKAEFGWSRRTAYNFIAVHDQFSRANFAQLDIAPSALYLLAAPSTPPEAREEALTRAEQGEAISHAAAREIVAQHKPTPATPPSAPTAPAVIAVADVEEPAPARAPGTRLDMQPSAPPPAPASAATPAPVAPAQAAPKTLDMRPSAPAQAAPPAAPTAIISIRVLPGNELLQRQVQLSIADEGTFPRVWRSTTFTDLPATLEEACENFFQPTAESKE